MRRTEMLGRLGRDPELRSLPSGEAVVNFSLADSEKWRDKNTGETQERTEWVRWVGFGRQAEIIAQYAKKGDQLWCAGKQRTREWEKDGQKHYSTEIRLFEFEFVGSRGERQESNNNSSPGDFGPPPADDFDDDIPF